MRFPKNKALAAVATSLALVATLLSGCGAGAPASSQASSDDATTQGVKEAATKAFSGEGLVSKFIGERFYNKKVTNEDEAMEAVKSAYDRMGADDSVVLELSAVRPVEDGNTYYIYHQKLNDIVVHTSSVKLVVNKDGDVVALVSSILPNVGNLSSDAYKIDAKKAEEIVARHCKEEDKVDAKIASESTEQTVITVPNTTDQYLYAWVVYTQNYLNDNAHMAYLAHYVGPDGDYLYALPIAEPRNADALAGDRANFDFGKFTSDTWKGTVKLHDGSTKEISVPVLVDPESKDVLLADAKRKILCADFATYNKEDKLSPRVAEGNAFDNTELLAYETFIRVWDYYNSIGWTAPDGDGTPTLLLMDYVDDDGEPQDEAFYSGKKNGFQTFTFNRLNPDGENLDIVAHEFTHCVTSTTMLTNKYLNETGAINEGMSDVMGNAIQMIVENKPDEAWLMGAGSGRERVLRNMKDPHELNQPEYTWDMYYTPHALMGSSFNDNGGVHVNASLLNKISYKLDQAGMSPEEQFGLWLSVALAMTPNTDYPQMAEILPWCLEDLGYTKYADALKNAISEAALTVTEEPQKMPQGSGQIAFTYPSTELADKGQVRVTLSAKNSATAPYTYPAATTGRVSCFVPAGEYRVAAFVGAENTKMYVYHNGSWEEVESLDSASDDSYYVKIEEGKTFEPATQGLPQSL